MGMHLVMHLFLVLLTLVPACAGASAKHMPEGRSHDKPTQAEGPLFACAHSLRVVYCRVGVEQFCVLSALSTKNCPARAVESRAVRVSAAAGPGRWGGVGAAPAGEARPRGPRVAGARVSRAPGRARGAYTPLAKSI